MGQPTSDNEATFRAGRPPSPRAWRTDLILAAAIAAAALAVNLPFANLGLMFGDDGYLAYGAQRILEGQMLYRDFERGYPPGIFYLYALVFGVFGYDLLFTRIGAIIMLAALGAGTYCLARPLAPRWAAALAGVLVLCLPPPAHKTFVPLAALAALAICGHLARHPYRSRTLLWAGLGLGCVALFRQEVAGFGLLIAAGTIAIRESQATGYSRSSIDPPRSWMRRVALAGVKLGAGVALIWAPLLVFYAVHGGLFAMIEQVGLAGIQANRGTQIQLPGLFEGVSSPEHLLSSLWEQMPATLFYFPGVAAACGLAIALVQLLRGSFKTRHAVVLQWALLTVLMHSLFLHRSDMAHVKQMLVIPILILAYVLGALWRDAWPPGAPTLARAASWGRLAVVVLVCAWTLTMLGRGYRTRIVRRYQARAHSQLLDEPRAPFALDPSVRKTTARVLRELRSLTRPGEPIFVAPYAPLFYFLANRPNPTRYDIITPGHPARTEVQEEIVRVLEGSGVNVILVRKIALDGRKDSRFPRYTPILAQYMRTRFELHSRTGEWALHVRREVDAAETDRHRGGSSSR